MKEDMKQMVADIFADVDNEYENKKRPAVKEDGDDEAAFVDAMWKHSKTDDGFDRFYDEHKDDMPTVFKKLGREGLSTRYNAAKSYSRDSSLSQEDIKKQKQHLY